ncbi:40192_t:CDS:2 [Gigaspora margarita]|uniref:40192_t:CDS:1 n=1 Tax=Gigaspora margarita TaxID=4874 RepID=A0ABN7W7R8_GIGMA|nr:40192_t:CDS:2 [Gigaspora margarita]
MKSSYFVPEKSPTPSFPTIHLVEPIPEIPVNAAAQKSAANAIEIAKKKLLELMQMYNITTDLQFRCEIYTKIEELQTQVKANKNRIFKLKRNAKYSQNCKKKKQKILIKNQEVIKYDQPGHPSLLFKYPHLHDYIHESVKNGSANKKRRKEIVKVRIIENLCKNLEENYGVYMVSVASVSHTKTHEHPDTHYCFASIKYAKQFASFFANMLIIISQDNKAKIDLGVSAISRTFHRLQSINDPICIPDHDFWQLAIFVRHQWSLGTSSLTHIQDLEMDGEPDKNPRHLKNIKSYCLLFQKFNLDDLTVRTNAPGQSKYNPVERGMTTLSCKLAGVVLPIDHFGTHLNSQSKVINPELALKNFKYAGEALCDIWRHDLIFGKNVNAQYIEEFTTSFKNLQFEGTDKEKIEELERQNKETQKKNQKTSQKNDDLTECFISWLWIERYCNLYQYFLDIKRCTDTSCCGPPRAKEAMDFLQPNNGFLPPVSKAKDEYFINPIHLLEYYDLLKIPNYDSHCLSLDETTYSRLNCSKCNKYLIFDVLQTVNASC